jgi:hypothetical protein
MEKVKYKGWPNCYRLSNDLVDLIVTTDVGPRIIRFGFVGEENEFGEFEDMLGKTGGDEWRIYGGHRLWRAPETRAHTYFPDNSPVEIEQHDGFVRVVQPTEAATGIQKEIDIQLSAGEAHVKLTHRLRNTNSWAEELAVWAISLMVQGGKCIIPLPPRGSHEENLLPINSMALWAYTDMADPRWTWGTHYIMLRQDPAMARPQKIGVMAPDGWAAYARDGHLFVKKFTYVPDVCYPDFGCHVETFANADFIEIETVGPLVSLEPGAAAEHVEHWFLFRDVPVPDADADVDRDVLLKVEAAKVA